MTIVTKLTEGQHTWEFMVSEEDAYFCREQIAIDKSQTLVPGTVIAQKGGAANAVTVGGVDHVVGDDDAGLLVLKAGDMYAADVQHGMYIVVCTLAGVDGTPGPQVHSTWNVIGPDGEVVGEATAGSAFADEIKFTIADVATNDAAQHAIGDMFHVHVDIQSLPATGYWGAWVADDADYGTAAGIIGYAITTGAGAYGKSVAIVRGPTQVRGVDLKWSGTPTAPQKSTAYSQLLTAGIVVR